MKQIIVIFLLFIGATSYAQTFTFECFCRAEMTGDSCDICPGTVITSRSFSGLLIYRNGVKFRWIDQPYMVRTRPGNNVEFLEQGPTPDKITIALAQTPYSTMQGYIDSTYCTCGDLVPLWYASDSTNFSPIYQGDTVKIVGQGATTVTFDSVLQKYVVYSPPAGGSGTVANFSFTDGSGFDGTVTNPTTTPNLSLQTTVTGPIYGAGGSLLPVTVGSGLTFSAPTLSAVDISAANEGILGVGAGGASSSTILSNTTGATGITINAAGINTITESTSSNGGSITITGTEVDGSVTNEAQTLSIAGATNPTVTLSTAGGAGGGSFQLTNGTGIAITLAGTVATIASTGTATAWINGGNSFGGTPSIGNNDNVPLLFETNGTEKYRLTAAGELLLGTTTTGAKLNVSGIASTVGILAAGGSVASGTALMRATGTVATGFGYVFDGDASNAGGNIISRVRNSSNTASSNAIHQIAVAGTTALDPFTQYQVEGVSGNTWSVGISNANADKFCITPDVTPALSAIGFQMNTTGEGGFSSSPSANHSAIWGLNKPLGLPSGTSAGRALGTNSAIWYNSTILGTEIFCASHNIYKRLTSNGTPTINMVSNSGTGATAILSSGSNDMAGQITFTVGSTGILAGNQFEVQFAGSFSGQVFVDLQARNAAMAAQLANVFVGTQSTGSFFFTATSALGAGSILIFNYRVTQ